MAALRIGKRRIKFRFFVFLSLLIALVVYLVNDSTKSAVYATVMHGQLSVEHQAQALIVRDEEIFKAPAYGKVTYLSSDGATVEEGKPVARIFKENFDEDALYQLYNVQEKIMSYQQDNIVDKLLDSDYKKINNDIESVVNEIQVLISSCEFSAIDRKENDLRSLMNKKQSFIDKRVDPDSYLQSLYKQEGELLAKLQQWIEEISTPESGVISYYVDGLENILGISSVDMLNIEEFRQLMDREPEEAGNANEAEAEQPLFKIVDSDRGWYAVFETEGNSYYEKGDSVSVQIFPADKTANTGTIYRVSDDKKSSLVVLKMDSDIVPVLNRRSVTLKTSKVVEGYIVPEKALKKSRGKLGIKVKDRDSHVFIEVLVKGVSKGYAVVTPVSLNQEINTNDRVVIN